MKYRFPVFALLLAFFLFGSCKDAASSETTASEATAPEKEAESEKVHLVESGVYLPDIDGLLTHFQRMYVARRFPELADTLRIANREFQASALHIQTAFAYWDAKMTDSAVAQIHQAINRGMSDPRVLEKFPKSETRLVDPKWDDLHKRLDSIEREVGALDHFEFRTDAMEAFWPYFEKAIADTTQARKALKQFILEGPPELRDYYVVRYGSVDNMYGQMVNGAPEYYSYLKERFSPDSLKVFRSQILEAMKKLKEFYSEAVFPKVYVVPGILNSGGTATEMGLYLGGDMYGKSEKMPVESLTNWQREAIMDFSDLPRLTIHELMHFQQHYGDTENGNTLLSAAIQEGVCDFLAELCLEQPMEHPNLDYMQDPVSKSRILTEFRREMRGEDTSKWLYNGGSIEDRPADLGYTMGYLITKSYFQRQKDKAAAVKTLLTTDDFMAIAAGSEYASALGIMPN